MRFYLTRTDRRQLRTQPAVGKRYARGTVGAAIEIADGKAAKFCSNSLKKHLSRRVERDYRRWRSRSPRRSNLQERLRTHYDELSRHGHERQLRDYWSGVCLLLMAIEDWHAGFLDPYPVKLEL